MHIARPRALYAREQGRPGIGLSAAMTFLRTMAPTGKNKMLVPLIAAVMLPSLGIATSYIHSVDTDVFLLVETVGELRTELVEGNYTDGHMCIDFPTYGVDEAEHKVVLDVGRPPGHYRLAYGSGFSAGGLISSGGASGLRFIDGLPFSAEEQMDDGNGTFTVNVTVNEKMEVLLEGKPFDGAYRLGSGKSWTLSYDTVREHQNAGDGCCNGSICKIEYIGKTTITNHGMWKKSNVEFD